MIINIIIIILKGRVAAGGRNWEGFGADPYLTGEAAVQSIRGVQSQGVVRLFVFSLSLIINLNSSDCMCKTFYWK